MTEEFISFVKTQYLFGDEDKIILAVSGGIDSVVLAALFHFTRVHFAIAHCNFSLRKRESENDQVFVKGLAEKYGVPFFSKRFDTLSYAKENGLSIQLAARKLRYEWFDELLEEKAYHYVATAHHLNDQAETFLYNLTRQSGISGLHGISPKQGRLVRPLMFAFREDIERFAAGHGLAYREDSSNKKDIYTRNYIRHKIIPAFETNHPEFVRTLSKTIMNIRATEDVYLHHIEDVKRKLFLYEGKRIKISIDELLQLHQPQTYLYELVRPFGFNFSQVSDIKYVLQSFPGKRFLSSTHCITLGRKHLIISGRSDADMGVYFINAIDQAIDIPIRISLSVLEKTSRAELNCPSAIAMLDLHKLSFPLMLRRWEKGDYFYPLGMQQRKKISDFFIDEKLSLPEKQEKWLLCSEKEIVWVVGHRIDDRFKVTESTTKILKLQADISPPA